MPSIKKHPDEEAGHAPAARHSVKRRPSGDEERAPTPPARQSLKKHEQDESRHASLKKHPSVDDNAARHSIKSHPSVEGGRQSFKKQAEEDKAAQARLERIKKIAEERYRFEKRVLTLCTGMLVVIAVLWTVALSTDHWYEMEPPAGGVLLRDTRTVLRAGNTGLWRLCTEQFHPANLSAYESITTTAAPVTTTRRPRAMPCKWMGLRGRKRKRCRQFITNRIKFGLAARRKSGLRLDIPETGGTGGATPATPLLTTASTPGLDYDAAESVNLTDWFKADFDETVQAGETLGTPDPADEDAILGPLDPEGERVLRVVEKEIRERIEDGIEDDLTVNDTLADVLEDTIEEITSVSFLECRVRELSEGSQQGTPIEWQMLSYMRTLVTFSVVSILLLVLGFLSALYTFKEPRYTFKRLSAGIQFISFCGLLVVIQVFRNAALYEQEVQLGGVPLTVGYSQVLAWLSLSAQILSSFFFLLYSRKKKRQKAPTEEIAMADEPTIIGR